MKHLVLLYWLATAGATSSSDAPLAASTPSGAAAAAATANATAPAADTTNATQPPDAANATAPSNSTGLLTTLRGRLANATANITRPSLRPVRKKLANLTGLHGLVSNKNNGSAANRLKTIFASAPVENATVLDKGCGVCACPRFG